MICGLWSLYDSIYGTIPLYIYDPYMILFYMVCVIYGLVLYYLVIYTIPYMICGPWSVFCYIYDPIYDLVLCGLCGGHRPSRDPKWYTAGMVPSKDPQAQTP